MLRARQAHAPPMPVVDASRRGGGAMTLLQVIAGGLLLGAVYALFSSGLTLIWGMMNVINFAHGEFVMIGMYLAFLIVTYLHGGPLVFGPAVAAALFLFGIVVYYALIRHVMRGPMLAQILSTFGLALLLRYLAFWIFTANFKTLPENLIPGVIDIGGIRLGMPQVVAGVVALLLTLGMHLLLTRTVIGSRLLAVSEDRQAAMLMGIRPDRMQALAWGLSAGGTGIAGALIATFYYISPTVGESLALTAFVVVTLGGFGSVPGAMLAGLLIGVIQSLSSYWLGPVYKDIIVYALFVAVLWVRPEGLFGKAG
jgi:branched-chain amino acid transport system permease protein